LGRVELAGKPYTAKQTDITGKIREVCIFPLKIVEEEFDSDDK
jgi:hypothetical protein